MIRFKIPQLYLLYMPISAISQWPISGVLIELRDSEDIQMLFTHATASRLQAYYITLYISEILDKIFMPDATFFCSFIYTFD